MIENKRKELKLSVPGLARVSGIHQDVLYKIENNTYVSDKNRWLLIEILNIPFDNVLFSKKIKEKRMSLKWLIPDLSRLSKVSNSVIYMVENKKKLPSMLLCYKLAKALDLQLEDFIKDSLKD